MILQPTNIDLTADDLPQTVLAAVTPLALTLTEKKTSLDVEKKNRILLEK